MAQLPIGIRLGNDDDESTEPTMTEATIVISRITTRPPRAGPPWTTTDVVHIAPRRSERLAHDDVTGYERTLLIVDTTASQRRGASRCSNRQRRRRGGV